MSGHELNSSLGHNITFVDNNANSIDCSKTNRDSLNYAFARLVLIVQNFLFGLADKLPNNR